MVRYYGRAKTRVGSVNTNQLGLKMSGCPSKIGKQGALVRYQSRRAKCNQKFIGPVYYHGQIWSWNNTGVERAPRTQSFNSGVGHINAPRFACGNTCATELTLGKANEILRKYFSTYFVALVGEKEKIESDIGSLIYSKLKNNGGSIIHLTPDSSEYKNAPLIVKNSINVLNSINFTAKVDGIKMRHIVGLMRGNDRMDLIKGGYGYLLKLSQGEYIDAFASYSASSYQPSSTYLCLTCKTPDCLTVRFAMINSNSNTNGIGCESSDGGGYTMKLPNDFVPNSAANINTLLKKSSCSRDWNTIYTQIQNGSMARYFINATPYTDCTAKAVRFWECPGCYNFIL